MPFGRLPRLEASEEKSSKIENGYSWMFLTQQKGGLWSPPIESKEIRISRFHVLEKRF